MLKDVSTRTRIAQSEQLWNFATNIKQKQGSSFIVCDCTWKTGKREGEGMAQAR